MLELEACSGSTWSYMSCSSLSVLCFGIALDSFALASFGYILPADACERNWHANVAASRTYLATIMHNCTAIGRCTATLFLTDMQMSDCGGSCMHSKQHTSDTQNCVSAKCSIRMIRCVSNMSISALSTCHSSCAGTSQSEEMWLT